MKYHYRLPLRRTPPGGSDYALALLLALGGALPASAADAPAPAEEAPLAGSAPVKADTALGKVTVTARRREEDSQKVPTPITVLGGETLEAQRISRVQDLQQVLPSVNVAYIHARQSSVAVRGIGNNPPATAWKAAPGSTSTTSTWGVREWPCSTCWTSSNWSCCAVRRALCSARTPPPGC